MIMFLIAAWGPARRPSRELLAGSPDYAVCTLSLRPGCESALDGLEKGE
jgi:hypothetical protein